MKTIMQEKEPIGAIVKKADRVFTRIVRKTQTYGTFNRIDWQLLNFIQGRKKASDQEVILFLEFFGERQGIGQLIDRFKNENLITANGGEIVITPKGERAFEAVLTLQEAIKEKGMQGITESDYATTLATLRKIMDNVKEYLPDEAEEKHPEKVRTSLFGETENEQAADLRALEQVVAKMEQAHNHKDPEGFADLFAADAVFVNAAGTRLYGKEAIYSAAKKVMQSFLAKSYARYEIASIRFISQDIAIADVNQHPITINGESLKGETAGIPTYVLRKNLEKGDWKIIAGQNTLVIPS